MSGSNGDGRAAWITAALEKHEGPLIRYAARLTGDDDRARDVVQETFLRLCRERRDMEGNHVAAWLYRVCRQRAMDACRKESRMQTVAAEVINVMPSATSPPVQARDDANEGGQVMRHLESLSANQQEVVRLKFSGGLSYREISEVTGLSVTNVGFLLHTAIKALREKMKAGGD